jgi:hypothetical protein
VNGRSDELHITAAKGGLLQIVKNPPRPPFVGETIKEEVASYGAGEGKPFAVESMAVNA